MFWRNDDDIEGLIAKKKYSKAEKLLRKEVAEDRNNFFRQQQLADVLAKTGEVKESVQILSRLVEDFAKRGFMTKAIATCKKLQRIKPDLEGLDEKVATLIQRRAAFEAEEAEQEQGSGKPARSPEQEEIALSSLSESLDKEMPQTGDASVDHFDVDTSNSLSESGSPLFRGFSSKELLAFIQGLNLMIFEPGEIVFTEGESGRSLFVLASGSLRVYVKSTEGRNEQVRIMERGEFFGEIGLLTGKARSATIVCMEHCEILELDVSTLNKMAKEHPAIPNIIREFARMRMNSPEELAARKS